MNEPRVPAAIDLQQKWRLGDQLGAGGFADVYRARSGNGTSAVVKLVRKLPGTHRELLFVDLDDVPNVVPIIDWGEHDDYWVLVMPEAEKSLRDRLIEVEGRLDTSEAVPVLIDVAQALVAIESRVVHRDIKPENILLLDGSWRLADFGIARYAEATTAPDTLKYSMSRAYAAPEQWRGERASSATDVYALGVVAYELLAGQLPFQGVDLRQQHLEETPETISGIPDRLRSLVNECLYKGPEARPRPQNLLARLQGSMQAASAAASRLQQANALAVQRKAEDERQQSAAQVEAERRRTLRAAAEQSLETTLALLHQQIADNAPAVRVAGSPPRSWALNDATLRMGTITASCSETRRTYAIAVRRSGPYIDQPLRSPRPIRVHRPFPLVVVLRRPARGRVPVVRNGLHDHLWWVRKAGLCTLRYAPGRSRRNASPVAGDAYSPGGLAIHSD